MRSPIKLVEKHVVVHGIEYLIKLSSSKIPEPLDQIPPSPHRDSQPEDDKDIHFIRTPTPEE